MKDMGRQQGTSPDEVIVGKDTVYVHTNIEEVTKDAEGNEISGLYEYDETQYDKDEYIKSLSNQATSIQEAIAGIYDTIASASTESEAKS